jgi:hypothetical protein
MILFDKATEYQMLPSMTLIYVQFSQPNRDFRKYLSVGFVGIIKARGIDHLELAIAHYKKRRCLNICSAAFQVVADYEH